MKVACFWCRVGSFRALEYIQKLLLLTASTLSIFLEFYNFGTNRDLTVDKYDSFPDLTGNGEIIDC